MARDVLSAHYFFETITAPNKYEIIIKGTYTNINRPSEYLKKERKVSNLQSVNIIIQLKVSCACLVNVFNECLQFSTLRFTWSKMETS